MPNFHVDHVTYNIPQKFIIDSSDNLPDKVQKDIEQLWEDRCYGNDNYYARLFGSEDEESYPQLCAFIEKLGLCTTDVLIHHWW